jgi:hypothetical protein
MVKVDEILFFASRACLINDLKYERQFLFSFIAEAVNACSWVGYRNVAKFT